MRNHAHPNSLITCDYQNHEVVSVYGGLCRHGDGRRAASALFNGADIYREDKVGSKHGIGSMSVLCPTGVKGQEAVMQGKKEE